MRGRVIKMNKDKTLKIVGTVVTLVGFGITFIQKQLDDRKLEDLVKKEVQRQLETK